MIFHSHDASIRCTTPPNRIEIPNRRQAQWIKRAYKFAREQGCPRWAARTLVWDTLFVSHLADGGNWSPVAEKVS